MIYICLVRVCLGPKANTLSDHWHMIWQENIAIVVALANVYENGKVIAQRSNLSIFCINITVCYLTTCHINHIIGKMSSVLAGERPKHPHRKVCDPPTK